MPIIYTRTGNPNGGKQGEALAYFKARASALKRIYGYEPDVMVRVGGPVGQVIMVARLKDLAEFESAKRKEIAETMAGKIPTPAPDVFASGEDNVWMDV